MWSENQGSQQTHPDRQPESNSRYPAIHTWLQCAISYCESHSHIPSITHISPYISHYPVGLRGVEQQHINFRNKISPDTSQNEGHSHTIIEKHCYQTDQQA